jgi:methylated-DNA-[protein]-cysteine S-methyltransferase
MTAATARSTRTVRLDRFTWTVIDPTPVGPLLAVASPAGLCVLEFDGTRRARDLGAVLAARFPDLGGAPDSLVEASPKGGPLAPVRAWLKRYFGGEIVTGRELPLDLRGTEFERRVWNALLNIPFGETRAYGQLATGLGSKDLARAVGLANSRNPVAVVVPCHRVIGANGSLTGFAGGMARKRWLLDHERGVACEVRGEPRQLALLGE